jgi:molybdenum cofactor cytidylyltransferase
LKFGLFPTSQAEGCILAHAAMAGEHKIKKGTALVTEHIRLLTEAGISEIVAAKLDPGDVPENEAARRVAAALCGPHIECDVPATGRVNLYATHNGVFVVEKAGVDELNRLDPAITFATLAPFASVTAGQMVATVKIIPLAVAGRAVEQVESACKAGKIGTVLLAPVLAKRVAVVSTLLPGLKPTVIDKTLDVLRARLLPSTSTVVADIRVPHKEPDLASAIQNLGDEADVIIIFGASAVIDPADVVPSAIAKAGGSVAHLGMPVDPGNLLVLGKLGKAHVIGAPGCARSPKENGFDHVLNRLLANVPIEPEDIMGMGVGGLLMEIASRPQPREGTAKPKTMKIEAVVLAAGQSRRSGMIHKLTAEFEGEPLLRRTVATSIEAGFPKPHVVLGFQRETFETQLSGLACSIIVNHDFAAGISTSLKCAIASLDRTMDGALILLADMPVLTAADIRKLTTAFQKSGGLAIVRATDNGKRGNPVILPRSVFPEIMKLQGDVGAKPVIEGFDGKVIDVEIGRAASIDVDTVEAIQAAGGKLPG